MIEFNKPLDGRHLSVTHAAACVSYLEQDAIVFTNRSVKLIGKKCSQFSLHFVFVLESIIHAHIGLSVGERREHIQVDY